MMIYNMPTIQDAWARVQKDVYWTSGVWDKEKARIEHLLV
jgi:hypothetical protein